MQDPSSRKQVLPNEIGLTFLQNLVTATTKESEEKEDIESLLVNISQEVLNFYIKNSSSAKKITIRIITGQRRRMEEYLWDMVKSVKNVFSHIYKQGIKRGY